MAIDTRDRRASALAAGLAFLIVLPAPDGLAFDQGDRQQVTGRYRGIAAGAAVIGPADVVNVAASFRSRVLASATVRSRPTAAASVARTVPLVTER